MTFQLLFRRMIILPALVFSGSGAIARKTRPKTMSMGISRTNSRSTHLQRFAQQSSERIFSADSLSDIGHILTPHQKRVKLRYFTVLQEKTTIYALDRHSRYT